jgi:hypothetical protein
MGAYVIRVTSFKLYLITLDDVIMGCLLQVKTITSIMCFRIIVNQGALLLIEGKDVRLSHIHDYHN